MNELKKTNDDSIRIRLPKSLKERFMAKGYDLSEFVRMSLEFAISSEDNYKKIMFPTYSF